MSEASERLDIEERAKTACPDAIQAFTTAEIAASVPAPEERVTYEVVEEDCTRTNANDGTDFWIFTLTVRNTSEFPVDVELTTRVFDEKLPPNSRTHPGQHWTDTDEVSALAPGTVAELFTSGPRDDDQIGPVRCTYQVEVAASP